MVWQQHVRPPLKALSVDFVKIGGHYVRGVVEDPCRGRLVSTVNEIGRIMSITPIAEEVESEQVLEKLRDLGMGYAQGPALDRRRRWLTRTGTSPSRVAPVSVTLRLTAR